MTRMDRDRMTLAFDMIYRGMAIIEEITGDLGEEEAREFYKELEHGITVNLRKIRELYEIPYTP